MQIARAELHACPTLTGAVVVIDVLRSFSTAAYAFAAGARGMFLVETPAEAEALRPHLPEALTVGAVGGGAPIPGFDIGNSPSALAGQDLRGRDIIHCTAGGVRGLVACQQAERLLAASLVCAQATARLLRRLAPPKVTLVTTGEWVDRNGDEDHACADYIAALLRDETPDPEVFVRRVRTSDFGRRFGDPKYPALPVSDLDQCVAVDRFDFAMHVRRNSDHLVMEAVVG
jgi:2-phosphosulfolactate phosphatase